MTTINEIVHEIEKLQPYERAQIVDTIMRDVIHLNKDIDKIWTEEASKRWAAYKKGNIKLVSYEEAMSKYK